MNIPDAKLAAWALVVIAVALVVYVLFGADLTS